MSWIRACAMPRCAITAFSHFSTACWVWKPMIPSAISGFSPNSRTAVASSCAFRARRAASSACSSLDKNSSGLERLVDHRPRDITPFIDLLLAHHNHVKSDFEISQLSAQTSRLCSRGSDLRLDHEEVEITRGTGVAAGVRPKEDHPGAVGCGGQSSPGLSDQALVGHGITVAEKCGGAGESSPARGDLDPLLRSCEEVAVYLGEAGQVVDVFVQVGDADDAGGVELVG
jgi:hypothetical protein